MGTLYMYMYAVCVDIIMNCLCSIWNGAVDARTRPGWSWWDAGTFDSFWF